MNHGKNTVVGHRKGSGIADNLMCVGVGALVGGVHGCLVGGVQCSAVLSGAVCVCVCVCVCVFGW